MENKEQIEKFDFAKFEKENVEWYEKQIKWYRNGLKNSIKRRDRWKKIVEERENGK